MAEARKAGKHEVKLTGADGSMLRVLAKVEKKSGRARSYIIHATAKNGDGKRTHTRGASATHQSMDEAVKAVQGHITAATKIGWVLSPTKASKADAFDAAHIPAPKPAGRK